MPVIVIISLLVIFFGIMSLSQATLGVGLIGIACYLGIMARIAQASAHRTEYKNQEVKKP